MSEPITGERTRLWLGLLAFLWIAGVVGLYYFWHKPLSPSAAYSIALSAWQMFAAAGILTIGGATGRVLLRSGDEQTAHGACLEAAIGMGSLSVILLFLGWLGALNQWLLLLIWGGLLLGLRNPARSWWIAVFTVAKQRHTWNRTTRFLAGLVILMVVLPLPVALSPPLKFDALVYHLALPQAYLAQGGVRFLPWLFYWGMPQVAELAYTWGMALAGAPAAAVVGWLTGALVIAGVVGMLSDVVGPRAAWIGAGSLVAGLSLASSLAWAYVGWISMLFGIGLLESLRRWRGRSGIKAVITAGLCAGMAFGVKYTAGVLLPAGLAVFLFSKPASISRRLESAVIFLGAALLALAPWLIKNAIATGNPFYPLLFPSGAMSPLRLALFQDQPAWGGLADALLLPLRATFLGIEGAQGFSAGIGPLLLGLGIFAALPGRGSRSESAALLRSSAGMLALVCLAIWAFAGRLSGLLIQTRLYLSIFPAFAILAGIGYQSLLRWESARFRIGWLFSAVVVLVLGLNVMTLTAQTVASNAVPGVLGLTTDEEYLDANLGWFALVSRDIRLMNDTRVLMLWEPRSFYCRPVCQPDEILDRWLREVRTRQRPDAIVQAWQSEGFSHLLLNVSGLAFTREHDPRYTTSEWQVLEELLAGLKIEKDYDGVYQLFRLSP